MIKKADIFLMLSVILVAVVMLCGAFVLRSDGKKAVVTVDGEVFGEYLLSEDQTIAISTKSGNNTVCISDGKVTVTTADCPDHYCVRHIAIDSVGETIVCLPHRVIIEIKE